MNKKILLSLSVIAAAAAIVIGGTRAFFSDTETSTGNTFTAGSIDLKIDSTATYNGVAVPAATWAEKDLVPTADKFFNFADVKPGDTGENTISLHVINNDAWVCAVISNLTNNENGLTEPESAVDTTPNQGELQQNLVMTIWRDDGQGGGVPGDNIQNGAEETLYTGAPQAGAFALYDSTTGTPLTGDTTGYVGVSWTLPASTGNEVQTDSMTGDIGFTAVQSRNNASFKCSDGTPVVVNSNNLNGWYFYNDQTDTTQTEDANHEFVTGPATPPAGTGSVHLTKTTTDKFGIATNQFVGTQLSTVTALSFSTYRASGTAAQAPSLGFDIDSDTTDVDAGYQGRLTYEPYFTHSVNTGSWQTWNTQDNAGTGNWWFSHATLSNGAASVCTQANPCTWSELTTAYPNLAIAGRFILRTNGADNEAADMNVDNLVIKTGATTQTFDFEN